MSKWILYSLIGLLLLVLAIGFAIPSRWRVSRSTIIQASPSDVFGLVGNLRRWSEWTEWNNAVDKKAEFMFSGPPLGTGSTMEWHGEGLGTGRIEIVAAEPPRDVRFDVMTRHHESARGHITIEPVGGQSRVTWELEGDAGANPIVHLFIPSMKAQVGEQLDEDLQKLATVATKAPPPG
jgi:hypothetical protein